MEENVFVFEVFVFELSKVKRICILFLMLSAGILPSNYFIPYIVCHIQMDDNHLESGYENYVSFSQT